MFRRTLGLFRIFPLILSLTAAAGAENLPALSEWLPADAVLVLEVSQPAPLLDALLSPSVSKAVGGALTPGSEPSLKLQQLQGIVAYLELQLGTDWRTGLRGLLGGGAGLAVDATGGMILATDARDAELLKKLHEIVRTFASDQASKDDQPKRVASRENHGVTVWTFGTNEAHTLLGSRLLLANRPHLLDRVLDQRAEPKDNQTGISQACRAAREALGAETVATLFLNLQVLKLSPKVKQALANDGNPLGTLLLADTKEALRNAHWLAAGISVKDGQLSIKVLTDGQAPAGSKAAGFASPQGSGEGILPNLAVPGRIAAFSLYRDLRAFYAAKDELFPERTSGLVFFENMMGIFFSGIELTDGVLGEANSDLRVVVAAQHYDPAIGTPAEQVPGFAAVLRLRHPQAFGEVVEEAWQKALGLVNFTRGQKALPGLVLDRDTHVGVKYSLSYYRPPSGKEPGGIDARFNYRPTLARPGDYVVLSSTDGLAKDLIDALQAEATGAVKPSAAAHTLAEIDGPGLRGLLLANREQLIRKNMLEKGHARQQAESEIGFLLTALDFLDRARLTVTRESRHPEAVLELKLKLPANKGEKPTSADNTSAEQKPGA